MVMLLSFTRSLPLSSRLMSRSLSTTTTTTSKPLFISPTSLHSLLTSPSSSSNPKPIVLDASWHMPGTEESLGWKEFKKKRIPGAGFWDLDVISGEDKTGLGLKHMIPDATHFAEACSRLGISRDSYVIFYDSKGLFSSPRAYWTFKSFGHPSLSILTGGLPYWSSLSLPLSTSPPIPPNPHSLPSPSPLPSSNSSEPFPKAQEDPNQYHETSFQPIMSVLLYDKKPKVESYFIGDIEEMEGDYEVPERVGNVREYEDMVKLSEEGNSIILDARPNARFTGLSPEPRPHLSSGHMPSSLSLPFTSLLTPPPTLPSTLLPPSSLNEIFSKTIGKGIWEKVEKGEENVSVSVTCGSGMTAAVVWLALESLGLAGGGKGGVGLYDESWMGWAGREGSRIEKDEEKGEEEKKE